MGQEEKSRFPVLGKDQIVDAFYELKETKKLGLRSGLGKIDERIGGIWRDGIVVSGDPGAGKTMFCLNLAIGFATSGNRIIYLDLENDWRDTVTASVSILLNKFEGDKAPRLKEIIDNPTLIVDNTHYWELIHLYFQYFTLVDIRNLRVNPGLLRSWVKVAVQEREERGKQVILFIDSINELATVFSMNRGLYESLEKWLAEIKLIRAQYQMPIVLVCHVPKDSTKEIFNPKGSSGIAHFARTQIMIIRPHARKIRAKILRAQFGNKGETELAFDPDRLGIKGIEE